MNDILRKIIFMKYLVFLSLYACIYSECEKNAPISYNGGCYKSCDNFNLFYYESSKTCTDNCKSVECVNQFGTCKSSCDKDYITLIKPPDQDNWCISDCFLFGKVKSDKFCLDSCKSNNYFFNTDGVCENTCKDQIYEDQDETYCTENCILYGLYKNTYCTDNCKIYGKYLYYENCRDECNFEKPMLTEEENYCVSKCFDFDLVYSSTTKVCVKTCKSVDEIVDEVGVCDTICGYHRLVHKYNNENYCTDDCNLYGQVRVEYSYCIESCKSINKLKYDGYCTNECIKGYYIYRGKRENYCLTESTCLKYGKYLKSKYICSNECGEDKCYEECSNNSYYSIQEKTCINNCKEKELYLYENKFCVSSCGYDYPYILKTENENICVDECPESAKYIVYENYICTNYCPNLYIFRNFCIGSCPMVAPYVNKVNGLKFCVQNCHDLNLYNRPDNRNCVDNCKKYSKFLYKSNCYNSCPSMAPYKYYGEEENTCHKNCEEIGLKTNIVDNTCNNNW